MGAFTRVIAVYARSPVGVYMLCTGRQVVTGPIVYTRGYVLGVLLLCITSQSVLYDEVVARSSPLRLSHIVHSSADSNTKPTVLSSGLIVYDAMAEYERHTKFDSYVKWALQSRVMADLITICGVDFSAPLGNDQ